jgi:hypothetical protein
MPILGMVLGRRKGHRVLPANQLPQIDHAAGSSSWRMTTWPVAGGPRTASVCLLPRTISPFRQKPPLVPAGIAVHVLSVLLSLWLTLKSMNGILTNYGVVYLSNG